MKQKVKLIIFISLIWLLIKAGLMGTCDVFQLENKKQHIITQLLGVTGLYP